VACVSAGSAASRDAVQPDDRHNTGTIRNNTFQRITAISFLSPT
jgi:hypothetical protein